MRLLSLIADSMHISIINKNELFNDLQKLRVYKSLYLFFSFENIVHVNIQLVGLGYSKFTSVDQKTVIDDLFMFVARID